jgi:hypothetical protein
MVEQGELNRVLDELLHPTTSNERRREIGSFDSNIE